MTQICLFITFFETKNAINDMLEPGKKPNTKFGAPKICEIHEKNANCTTSGAKKPF